MNVPHQPTSGHREWLLSFHSMFYIRQLPAVLCMCWRCSINAQDVPRPPDKPGSMASSILRPEHTPLSVIYMYHIYSNNSQF